MRVSDIILGAKVNQPDGMKAKEERTVTGLASAIDGMFFAPLRRRADTLVSPAREQMERLAKGESLESIAADYGTLKSGESANA